MTKEMYISIFIIIVQVSFLKCLPIWSQGCYSKGDVRQVSFTTEEECGQICGQKLLNGELIVGAARDLVDCFCEVSTTGVTLYIGIQRHIDFEVLMLLFNPVSYSIGSLMKISVRISYFAKINDKSEIFMIDSLDDPVKRSGRFIISQLVDLGRSSFATRTLLRHNDSQLVNSIQETYNEDPPYGKVENYYDIIAKIGDMGAENKSTEWAVIQFSNETTTIVTLLPVTITRSVKTCSLKIFSSSKLTNENISVDVNITTTSDCTADLENLTISFNSDRELNFESIVKQDPSMNFSPVIEGGKLKRIFVRKIYIDSLLKFSISYVLNEDLIFEGKNAFIIVMKIWWMGINNDRFTQSFQKIIIQEIKKKLNKRDNTLVHPKWSYNNQNNTKIETTSFVYKCLPVTQRQQAPCYQTEKSSGRVVFLPSEIQDVLRYVPQTNTLYGFTFLNNIISLDLNKNAPPTIISNKKWLAIK